MSDLLTARDFAERWGGNVTPRWVLEQRLAHGWPCIKVGRTIRFTEEQFAEIKRRHTVVPDARTPALVGQTAASKKRTA